MVAYFDAEFFLTPLYMNTPYWVNNLAEYLKVTLFFQNLILSSYNHFELGETIVVALSLLHVFYCMACFFVYSLFHPQALACAALYFSPS
jgi:hypothetical protein